MGAATAMETGEGGEGSAAQEPPGAAAPGAPTTLATPAAPEAEPASATRASAVSEDPAAAAIGAPAASEDPATATRAPAVSAAASGAPAASEDPATTTVVSEDIATSTQAPVVADKPTGAAAPVVSENPASATAAPVVSEDLISTTGASAVSENPTGATGTSVVSEDLISATGAPAVVLEEYPTGSTGAPAVSEDLTSAAGAPALLEEPASAAGAPVAEEEPATATGAPARSDDPTSATGAPASLEKPASATGAPVAAEEPASTTGAPAMSEDMARPTDVPAELEELVQEELPRAKAEAEGGGAVAGAGAVEEEPHAAELELPAEAPQVDCEPPPPAEVPKEESPAEATMEDFGVEPPVEASKEVSELEPSVEVSKEVGELGPPMEPSKEIGELGSPLEVSKEVGELGSPVEASNEVGELGSPMAVSKEVCEPPVQGLQEVCEVGPPTEEPQEDFQLGPPVEASKEACSTGSKELCEPRPPVEELSKEVCQPGPPEEEHPEEEVCELGAPVEATRDGSDSFSVLMDAAPRVSTRTGSRAMSGSRPQSPRSPPPPPAPPVSAAEIPAAASPLARGVLGEVKPRLSEGRSASRGRAEPLQETPGARQREDSRPRTTEGSTTQRLLLASPGDRADSELLPLTTSTAERRSPGPRQGRPRSTSRPRASAKKAASEGAALQASSVEVSPPVPKNDSRGRVFAVPQEEERSRAQAWRQEATEEGSTQPLLRQQPASARQPQPGQPGHCGETARWGCGKQRLDLRQAFNSKEISAALLIRKYDRDDSGVLEAEEMRSLLQDYNGGRPVRNDELRFVLTIADKNHDDCISSEELMFGMKVWFAFQHMPKSVGAAITRYGIGDTVAPSVAELRELLTTLNDSLPVPTHEVLHVQALAAKLGGSDQLVTVEQMRKAIATWYIHVQRDETPIIQHAVDMRTASLLHLSRGATSLQELVKSRTESAADSVSDAVDPWTGLGQPADRWTLIATLVLGALFSLFACVEIWVGSDRTARKPPDDDQVSEQCEKLSGILCGTGVTLLIAALVCTGISGAKAFRAWPESIREDWALVVVAVSICLHVVLLFMGFSWVVTSSPEGCGAGLWETCSFVFVVLPLGSLACLCCGPCCCSCFAAALVCLERYRMDRQLMEP